jgi:hypothetical protein
MAYSLRGPWSRSQDSSRGSHDPQGEDEKVVYRAKPGRCLEQTEREVSEMENARTGKLLTGQRNLSTGERGVRKRTRLVRRGAGGKGPSHRYLACCLPYYSLSYCDLEEMMKAGIINILFTDHVRAGLLMRYESD